MNHISYCSLLWPASGVVSIKLRNMRWWYELPDRMKRLWDFSPQARFSVGASTEQLLEQIRASDQKVDIHTLYYPLSTVQVVTAERRHGLAIEQRLQDLTTDLLRQYDYGGGDAVSVTHLDLLRNPADVRE